MDDAMIQKTRELTLNADDKSLFQWSLNYVLAFVDSIHLFADDTETRDANTRNKQIDSRARIQVDEEHSNDR